MANMTVFDAIDNLRAAWRFRPDQFVKLRVPLITNLHSDPFEKAQFESIYYTDWSVHHVFLLVPAQALVAQWIQSFKDFPPRQKPASFSIDEVMKRLQEGSSGKQ